MLFVVFVLLPVCLLFVRSNVQKFISEITNFLCSVCIVALTDATVGVSVFIQTCLLLLVSDWVFIAACRSTL